jgi:signal transduction histidine kinase
MDADGSWILVVDDDPDILETACDAIREEHGCVTRAAKNGQEALDILARSESPPCLILLDVNMPVMNGLELLEILEKDEARAGVPVVMMTANPSMGRRTNGGALAKPFTVDALHKFIRSHCGSPGASARGNSVISRVASMVANEKESIILQWVSRLRNDPRIPQARDLDETDLRNNIPAIIDELTASLAQSAKMSPTKGANAQQIGGGEGARGHAHHRLEQRYTLAEELREMAHLRMVFVEMCTRAGLVLEGHESQLVHAVFDETMITAAVEMDKSIQADLHRDIATRELFSAILGHDLRTPLTGIMLTSSKLLRRAQIPEDLRKDYQRVASNAERMKRLIDDLLDLARARAHGNSIPIARQPADLHAICEQIIDEVRLVSPQSTISFQSPDTVPGEWDPDRLGQLIQNLLRNAIDYSPPHSPVQIELREQAQAVEIVVHNLGPPIRPELLSTIFDPFSQGEPGKQLAPHSKGIGLGLFIAKLIAESHGGSIHVTSEQDAGTTFVVSLPRSPAVRLA